MARVLPVLREIVIRHQNEHVIVVSHKATIRLALASLLGFDPRAYRDCLDQLPCSLNILEFRDPVRVRLMVFNDVSHYAGYPGSPGPRLSKWWE
jgi:broad specificity phosphatase PhoE